LLLKRVDFSIKHTLFFSVLRRERFETFGAKETNKKLYVKRDWSPLEPGLKPFWPNMAPVIHSTDSSETCWTVWGSDICPSASDSYMITDCRKTGSGYAIDTPAPAGPELRAGGGPRLLVTKHSSTCPCTLSPPCICCWPNSGE